MQQEVLAHQERPSSLRDSWVRRTWELSGSSPCKTAAFQASHLGQGPAESPCRALDSVSHSHFSEGHWILGRGERVAGPGVHPTILPNSRFRGNGDTWPPHFCREGHSPSLASRRALVSGQHQDTDSDEVACGGWRCGPVRLHGCKAGISPPTSWGWRGDPAGWQLLASPTHWQAQPIPGPWRHLPPCGHICPAPRSPPSGLQAPKNQNPFGDRSLESLYSATCTESWERIWAGNVTRGCVGTQGSGPLINAEVKYAKQGRALAQLVGRGAGSPPGRRTVPRNPLRRDPSPRVPTRII